MAFSEGVKHEVKRKAHFKCCICKNIFVEVHHIIPQAAGGSDDIENAAPLCPNCHTNYGDNPTKRKAIRQLRDLWYELCEKSEMTPDYTAFSEKLDDLYDEFRKVRDNQDKQTEYLREMKGHLSSYYQGQADRFSKADSIAEMVTISGSSSAAYIESGFSEITNKYCPACGENIMPPNARFCSYCGQKL